MTWFANSGSQKVTSQGIEEEEEETKFFIRERRRRSVPISFSGKKNLTHLTTPLPLFLQSETWAQRRQRATPQLTNGDYFSSKKVFFPSKEESGKGTASACLSEMPDKSKK